MLQIKRVKLLHKKDYRVILEDFSLVLNAGDKAVIIGEEGNGKSTLLKWIYNPELIEDYIQAEGERICHNESLGYLPQELSAEDREKTVYEFLCEEASFYEQTPKELGALAQSLQLTAEFFYESRQLKTLSGGEKVKVQMARLLMKNPSILLLDEPSNDIDIETLEWLEEFIKKSKQIVLYISHDETLIENTANMVIHIEQIRRKTVSRYTVAKMSYRNYVEERLQKMENQEQQAMNDRRQEKIRQEKFRRIQQSVEHAQNSVSRQEPHIGQLLKKKMKAVKSMEKRFEREREDMTQMPETEEAIFIKFGEHISMPSGKTVVEYTLEKLCVPIDEDGQERMLSEHIYLQVRGAQKVCIVGQNGVGKTTLLRKIAQDLLQRKDIKAAYMPQNYEDALDMTLTPVEYLSSTGDKEEITRIRTYLGSMKYTADEMSHPIQELSGGQKAKILLLKMSMSGANVLILDEPTRNFSPLSGPVIREVLAAFGGAIISISHDRKYISEVCNCVYRLTDQGLLNVEK